MAKSERIKYLLHKYFHNQCTDDEQEELMQWMQLPENQHGLESYLHEHWQELKDELPPTVVNYDQVWQNLQQKIEDTSATSNHKLWYKIAAAVFLIAIISTLAFLQLLNKQSSPEIAIQTVSNPKGERSQVKLPDGSVVWLNAESTISYPLHFSQSIRSVALSGEAYFDVVKDLRPFIITTESADIEVLGTSFNVSAYPEDENFSTTLVEGAVMLRIGGGLLKKATEAKLAPNQRARFLKSEKTLELEMVEDISLYTSWKDGKLIFENTSFSSVATKLERWFGKEIKLLDEIKNERFTGTFENESLEQILEIVNVSTPIDYSISGNHVLIKMKN